MDTTQLQRFSQQAMTRSVQALAQANQVTSRYGLVLTEQQMLSLTQRRQEALVATGRGRGDPPAGGDLLRLPLSLSGQL